MLTYNHDFNDVFEACLDLKQLSKIISGSGSQTNQTQKLKGIMVLLVKYEAQTYIINNIKNTVKVEQLHYENL